MDCCVCVSVNGKILLVCSISVNKCIAVVKFCILLVFKTKETTVYYAAVFYARGLFYFCTILLYFLLILLKNMAEFYT